MINTKHSFSLHSQAFFVVVHVIKLFPIDPRLLAAQWSHSFHSLGHEKHHKWLV